MVDGLTWNIVTIIIRNAPHPPSPDGPPWGSTQAQADAQAEDQHLGTDSNIYKADDFLFLQLVVFHKCLPTKQN